MPTDILLCPECGFECHRYCKFCIACGAAFSVMAGRPEAPPDVSQLSPGEEGSAPPESVQSLLRSLAAAESLEVRETPSAWTVTVPLEGGRSQRVHVRFSGTDDDGDEVVSFFSISAPSDPVRSLSLLRMNAAMKYCAITSCIVEGEEVFGVIGSQLVKTADEAEVRKLLLEVARRADSLEATLTGGGDRY